jgi:hypothetical protein
MMSHPSHQYTQVAAKALGGVWSKLLVAPRAKTVHIDGAMRLPQNFKTQQLHRVLNKSKRSKYFHHSLGELNKSEKSIDFRSSHVRSGWRQHWLIPFRPMTAELAQMYYCAQLVWRGPLFRVTKARNFDVATTYLPACPLRLQQTWWRGIRNW